MWQRCICCQWAHCRPYSINVLLYSYMCSWALLEQNNQMEVKTNTAPSKEPASRKTLRAEDPSKKCLISLSARCCFSYELY